MQATCQLIERGFIFCHVNQLVVNMSHNLVNVIIYSKFCLSNNLCVLQCKPNKPLFLFMYLNHYIPYKDFSDRCQPSDSGQCRINTNEETSSQFKETCKEVHEPNLLSSCSKKYLTIDSDGISFDPELDFCNDTYMKSKQSFCEHSDGSDMCTVDLNWIISSNPECFSRYRMTIDYTCEGKAYIFIGNKKKSHTFSLLSVICNSYFCSVL